MKGDRLPRGFAFQALDAAVNHGVGTSVRWMQRAAGVAEDGSFGPVTLAAVLTADVAEVHCAAVPLRGVMILSTGMFRASLH